MKVTIDLDRDMVIVPDNFFKKIGEDNERLKKFGAQPQKGIDRIKRSFEVAMSDTDTRLVTKANAKGTKVTKLPIDEKIIQVESSRDREAEAAEENDK